MLISHSPEVTLEAVCEAVMHQEWKGESAKSLLFFLMDRIVEIHVPQQLTLYYV